MSIVEIDLNQVMLQRLQEKAARQGLPVTEYAKAALEALAQSPDEPSTPQHSIMELEGLGAGLAETEF